MAGNDPRHVVTGEARLSYVFVLQPTKQQGQDQEKYSVTLLIPKSDVSTKARIDAAMAAAAQAGEKKYWGGPVASPANPVHDGDGLRDNKTPFGPECKGHWILKATSTAKPEIRDAGMNPILNETEIYSGMYGRAGITFNPYSVGGKKGICCKLYNVQKLRDGEPLVGRYTPEDDFGEPTTAYAPAQQPSAYAPAQPQYAQPAYTAPAQQGYPLYCPPAYAPYGAVNPITGQPIVG